MDTNQNKNEYIVDYLNFPETPKTIGHFFHTQDDRKKYTTPLIHKIFSIFEHFGIQSVNMDGESPVISFSESKHSERMRNLVGDRYILGLVRELMAIMQLLNIKSFKRNIENPSVKKLFQKTDKALFEHLNKSIDGQGS